MESRKEQSKRIRDTATQVAYNRNVSSHISNGEEHQYRPNGSFMSFTKGLRHDPETGLASSETQLKAYRSAIDDGKVANFDKIPIGLRDEDDKLEWFFHHQLSAWPKKEQFRRWESPTAGTVFDLEGPDAQAVTMPPAPSLNVGVGTIQVGEELAAEMAEVYLLALLRDVPLECFDSKDGGAGESKVDDVVKLLGKLPFYKEGGNALRSRPKGKSLTKNTVFRGQTPGERLGPYLSQFMLMGNGHLGGIQPETSGLLQYGSINIDLRVRIADTCKDYMTHWNEWLDVQHGANVGSTQTYTDGEEGAGFRHIATPRDMATYVHFDALYEAYLNACLWLLNVKAPLDTRFDDELGATASTQGFALQGGPHILTLVTEVATRALKAVRYQKFNNHLRSRPEVLAARIAAYGHGALPSPVSDLIAPLHDKLDSIGLLDLVKQHNEQQNSRHSGYLMAHEDNYPGSLGSKRDLPLLPMAFAEGSPMHPSYGAGHATVAGACVTMLKAFFDEEAVLVKTVDGSHTAKRVGEIKDAEPFSYVPSADGSRLNLSSGGDNLTVGHELNKLAANISIARNMGGVHFYTDYIESMRMGEEIAKGILEEQALTYESVDEFRVGFTTFDNQYCVVDKNGARTITQYA